MKAVLMIERNALPRRYSLVLLGLALAGLGQGVVMAPSAPLSADLVADLDRDGRKERVALDAARDPSLTVWRGKRCIWQGVPRRWRPWKLATADVDGDGRREIAVGLHKSTRYFPRPHNCLFLYSLSGQTVRPKWLGSSLSKPFTDFTFANLDGDPADELIAIERTLNGRQCVAVYSWSGFGFTVDWQRGDWRQVRLREARQGRVLVEADGQDILLGRTAR
jgi:hypothetical protein